MYSWKYWRKRVGGGETIFHPTDQKLRSESHDVVPDQMFYQTIRAFMLAYFVWNIVQLHPLSFKTLLFAQFVWNNLNHLLEISPFCFDHFFTAIFDLFHKKDSLKVDTNLTYRCKFTPTCPRRNVFYFQNFCILLSKSTILDWM